MTVLQEQVVRVSPRATAFTAVCEACAAEGGHDGWTGSTFAGRLDLDVDEGTFLCRRGHSVCVRRERGAARDRLDDAGTAAA